MSNQPNSTLKSILIFAGTYVATLVGTAVVSFIVMLALSPQSCADYGDALLVLWGIVGVLHLFSTAVLGVFAWRVAQSVLGRLGMVGAYALLMLITYLFFAFTVLVGFNC
ncbi:MAG: hypothetical protein OT477_04090 [Chloroflexi bacterium]|nr:hypothetical protein [Chloroflexota bacterium]